MMNLTKEQLAKAREAKTMEELIALAKAEGIDATEEEITKYWNSLHAEGELADEELDNVSGGCGTVYITPRPEINSADPRCIHCNHTLHFISEGISQVEIEGKNYICDEFRCYNSRCYGNDGSLCYLHVWEGDRWYSRREATF